MTAHVILNVEVFSALGVQGTMVRLHHNANNLPCMFRSTWTS